MAEINFSFKGVETRIAIRTNENRVNLLSEFILSHNRFKKGDNIPYLNNGNNILINRKLTFKENKNDKKEKKLNIIENVKGKENNNIMITNHIICPTCKENKLLNIKDFKIDFYGCKQNHELNIIFKVCNYYI